MFQNKPDNRYISPEKRFSMLDGLDFSDSPEAKNTSKVTLSEWNHMTKSPNVLSPDAPHKTKSNAGNLRKIAQKYYQEKANEVEYNTYDTKNDKIINNFIDKENFSKEDGALDIYE